MVALLGAAWYDARTMSSRINRWTILRRFRKFNKRYWDGSLREPDRITVIPAGQKGELVPGDDTWAYVGIVRGELVLEIRSMAAEVDETMLNATLLHEMIHIEIGFVGHNTHKWRSAVKRLSERGALREVI